ncbi:MAG: hypothetical protein GY711_14645 [bacterium]|nr:hypothetical protein [bacterium]
MSARRCLLHGSPLGKAIRTGAVLTALTALTACQSPPEEPAGELETPELAFQGQLVPGTTLAGPGGQGDSAGAPLLLRCRLVYIEDVYDGGLAPLATASRLVVDLRGKTPILPVAKLVADAAYAVGDDAEAWLAAVAGGAAGRTRELADETVVLPAGATYSLAAEADETVEDPRDWLDEFADRGPFPRRVTVWVSATASGPRVAVSVDDLDPDVERERALARLDEPNAMPGPAPPVEDESLRRETVLVDAAPTPGAPLLVRLPSPFDTGEGRAFAAIVELLDEPATEEARASAAESIAAAAANHEQLTAPLSVDGQDDLVRQQVLVAFRERGGRPALLLLAQESGAELTADLALVADDALFAAIDTEAFSRGEPAASTLGWELERAAWTVLARAGLQDELDGELEGVLLRHAGALARFPDVILDAVAASTDTRTLLARLEQEQRYFLEDSNPSARVRAHDWLVARERGVAGFDPLADRAARRAALEAEETP